MKIASTPPKLVEARRGGEFALECSARGRPAPEVRWLKNGIPVHDQVEMNEQGDFQSVLGWRPNLPPF